MPNLADMAERFKASLPRHWFPDDVTPVLGVVAGGIGATMEGVADTIAYARAQARLATATGPWLDLAGFDYLGNALPRRAGETDAAYRVRLIREVFRHRNTRAAIIAAIEDATGLTPRVFEPQRIEDTGAVGIAATMGYGVAGGYGSYDVPGQFFVAAQRPRTRGVAQVGGYGSAVSAYNHEGADYEYASIALIGATVGDDDIRAAILSVLPAGMVAWLAIGASIPEPDLPNIPLGLSA